mmetsp:Transcript_15992/g.37040  ORF Transcript_15992/g.37040 Transcript_15992/m.37040 type:complete len:228 (+) Transcript_15992:446-1129(+)
MGKVSVLEFKVCVSIDSSSLRLVTGGRTWPFTVMISRRRSRNACRIASVLFQRLPTFSAVVHMFGGSSIDCSLPRWAWHTSSRWPIDRNSTVLNIFRIDGSMDRVMTRSSSHSRTSRSQSACRCLRNLMMRGVSTASALTSGVDRNASDAKEVWCSYSEDTRWKILVSSSDTHSTASISMVRQWSNRVRTRPMFRTYVAVATKAFVVYRARARMSFEGSMAITHSFL